MNLCVCANVQQIINRMIPRSRRRTHDGTHTYEAGTNVSLFRECGPTYYTCTTIDIKFTGKHMTTVAQYTDDGTKSIIVETALSLSDIRDVICTRDCGHLKELIMSQSKINLLLLIPLFYFTSFLTRFVLWHWIWLWNKGNFILKLPVYENKFCLFSCWIFFVVNTGNANTK